MSHLLRDRLESVVAAGYHVAAENKSALEDERAGEVIKLD